MLCTVCTHPERQAIDCALLAGDATYEALSGQYGPSLSALWRHKKHLQAKMRRTEERLEHNLRQGYLFKFNHFLEVATDTVKTAGADGNSRLVLQAVREGTRILNFMTKLEVQLDQDTVYRLLTSPQWTTQGSLLPTDPQFIAGTRQTLADALFFACPELPPDADEAQDDLAEAADEEETTETLPLDTQNSELETLDLLQEVLPALIRSQLDPRKTADHKPKNQREISAKLARKTSRLKHNNNEYQKDTACQKNTRKNSPVGREIAVPPAVKQSGAQPVDLLDPSPATATPKPETENQKPETNNSELETPQPESLFVRLRRKWAQTAPASKYSCDSEQLYEEYLQEKVAAGLPDTLPEDPGPEPAPAAAHQPPDNANPQPETRNSESETPQPEAPPARKPLNPFTHPKEYYFALEHGYRIEDTPKNKPDRRWEEDFGNPRRIRGGY